MSMEIAASEKRPGKRMQLRYLSQSVLMEEAHTPPVVKWTLFTVCSTLVVFLVWASLAQISEVTKARGDVVPDGYVRMVQHLEGGIITDINVREGDLVKMGDLLLRLNGAGAQEDLREIEAKQLALELQAERLRAFVEDRLPAFSVAAGTDAPEVTEQQNIYDGMITAQESEKRIIETQISQKTEELAALRSKRQTLRQNLAVVGELLDMREALVNKGLSGRIQYLERQRELNNIKGELAELTSEIASGQQLIAEFENRYTSLVATNRDNAYQKLDEIEAELAQSREAQAKLRNRVARLEVRAPVEGLVKGIRFNTIGAVVAPGQIMLEVVPVNETLVVEARISANEIGHVRVGQTVKVKIGTYDFARYGALEGSLQSLSATTFVDEKGEPFYRGRVALARNYVGNQPDRNLILPGMTVNAEIVTGGKSVLAYLLKPVHTSLNSALTER